MADQLEALIQAGLRTIVSSEWKNWEARTRAFIAMVLGEAAANDFQALSAGEGGSWERHRAAQVGYLEGLASQRSAPLIAAVNATVAQPTYDPVKIFLVHGHDVAAKESVARFLERIHLDPVILHEQPNAGRTLIEKFEAFARVGFAVVLLTPDDILGAAPDSKRRARQNVILELGYFMGRLGRQRVCALHKPTVELPSDIQGILYIGMDDAGAWRTKLAQELVQAGYSINLQALLAG